MSRFHDTATGDLFMAIPQPSPATPGGMDFRTEFAVLLGDMLSAAHASEPGLDRFHIAARASRLAGKEISKSMLDGYTAESREAFNLPLWVVPALETACNSTVLSARLAAIRGGRLVLGPAALDEEIGRIEGERDELGERLKLLKDQRRRIR